MQEAIKEALLGLSEGGYPIGAVLIEQGKVIARGHNRWVQQKDPIAHAEMDCFRNSSRWIFNPDTVLYTTHVPCIMCSGAIVWFGIKTVIAGENRTYKCSTDFLKSNGVNILNLELKECIELMPKFKEKFPDIWKQDMEGTWQEKLKANFS
jgi:creatinine deaminase